MAYVFVLFFKKNIYPIFLNSALFFFKLRPRAPVNNGRYACHSLRTHDAVGSVRLMETPRISMDGADLPYLTAVYCSQMDRR